MAVNLGEDVDTTGAVYGQLAGAFYGVDGIPAQWRDRLARRADIENLADRLLDLAGQQKTRASREAARPRRNGDYQTSRRDAETPRRRDAETPRRRDAETPRRRDAEGSRDRPAFSHVPYQSIFDDWGNV